MANWNLLHLHQSYLPKKKKKTLLVKGSEQFADCFWKTDCDNWNIEVTAENNVYQAGMNFTHKAVVRAGIVVHKLWPRDPYTTSRSQRGFTFDRQNNAIGRGQSERSQVRVQEQFLRTKPDGLI